MLSFIKLTFERLIAELKAPHYRYLYHQFHIKSRLTGLIGPRGVGKTTLLLQFIKNNLLDDGEVFYFSADHIYFSSTTILEFIQTLYLTEDIKIFFIDEIHRYANWSQELKNLYDAFPSIKIVFSGSSSIDIIEGSHDLSRRASMFYLPGLSFREYLNFKTNQHIEPISYEALIKKPQQFNSRLSQIPKVTGLFNTYLQYGYYPFLFDEHHRYYEKIAKIIDQAVYEDIANFYHLKTPNLYYFKRILNFLATIPPGEVNTHNLARNLGIDYKTVFHYLTILSEAGLVQLIFSNKGGNRLLRKPEKIFLNNTTLAYALNEYLGENISKGYVRELFFIQSLKNAGVNIFHNQFGDFQTKKTIFEIGGKNKTTEQIKKAKLESFLVKDDILVSSKREIPLLYFGFIY